MSVSIAYVLFGLPFLLEEYLDLRLKKEQKELYKVMFMTGALSIPLRIMTDSTIILGIITAVQTFIIGISAIKLLKLVSNSGKKKD